MATVYRAECLATQGAVAVKILSTNHAHGPDDYQRFWYEVIATSHFHHPNIVNSLDCGQTDDGTPYFVMELLQGRTLSDMLVHHGTLPCQRALMILCQIAQALINIHECGIVHRDLKPDNIHIKYVVQPDEVPDLVKILDFGIAKFPELPDDPDAALGTPFYMAPEQIYAAQVDARTDIYQLGILFYEMLTGKPPFCAHTVDDVYTMHLNDPAPSPRQRRPDLDIPETAERLILKALEKDPAHRQQSAGEFLEELAGLQRCVSNRSSQRPAR